MLFIIISAILNDENAIFIVGIFILWLQNMRNSTWEETIAYVTA